MEQVGWQSDCGFSETAGVSSPMDLSKGKSMRRTEAGMGFGDSGAVYGGKVACRCNS